MNKMRNIMIILQNQKTNFKYKMMILTEKDILLMMKLLIIYKLYNSFTIMIIKMKKNFFLKDKNHWNQYKNQ